MPDQRQCADHRWPPVWTAIAMLRPTVGGLAAHYQIVRRYRRLAGKTNTVLDFAGKVKRHMGRLTRSTKRRAKERGETPVEDCQHRIVFIRCARVPIAAVLFPPQRKKASQASTLLDVVSSLSGGSETGQVSYAQRKTSNRRRAGGLLE